MYVVKRACPTRIASPASMQAPGLVTRTYARPHPPRSCGSSQAGASQRSLHRPHVRGPSAPCTRPTCTAAGAPSTLQRHERSTCGRDRPREPGQQPLPPCPAPGTPSRPPGAPAITAWRTCGMPAALAGARPHASYRAPPQHAPPAWRAAPTSSTHGLPLSARARWLPVRVPPFSPMAIRASDGYDAPPQQAHRSLLSTASARGRPARHRNDERLQHPEVASLDCRQGLLCGRGHDRAEPTAAARNAVRAPSRKERSRHFHGRLRLGNAAPSSPSPSPGASSAPHRRPPPGNTGDCATAKGEAHGTCRHPTAPAARRSGGTWESKGTLLPAWETCGTAASYALRSTALPAMVAASTPLQRWDRTELVVPRSETSITGLRLLLFDHGQALLFY